MAVDARRSPPQATGSTATVPRWLSLARPPRISRQSDSASQDRSTFPKRVYRGQARVAITPARLSAQGTSLSLGSPRHLPDQPVLPANHSCSHQVQPPAPERLWKCRVTDAPLGQPCGLPTFPQPRRRTGKEPPHSAAPPLYASPSSGNAERLDVGARLASPSSGNAERLHVGARLASPSSGST
jgi:hypothetical protein